MPQEVCHEPDQKKKRRTCNDLGVSPKRSLLLSIAETVRQAFDHRQRGEMTARPAHKKVCWPSIVILVGFLLALSVTTAHAAGRFTILNYICATHESARQVALERSWDRPESMPDNCRTLLGRVFDERVAEISEIVEFIPTEDGRWIEIGKVHRRLVETGYSAGISEHLLLF